MKGLALCIALLVALLTSSAFAASPESEDQMSEMENPGNLLIEQTKSKGIRKSPQTKK